MRAIGRRLRSLRSVACAPALERARRRDAGRDALPHPDGSRTPSSRRRTRFAGGAPAGARQLWWRREIQGGRARARGFGWLDTLSLDARLGVRMLAKHRWLTLVGGLAMAVAIAIGASAFIVIGVMLDPALPLPQGDRIVAVKYQEGEHRQGRPACPARICRLARSPHHCRAPVGVSHRAAQPRGSRMQRRSRSLSPRSRQPPSASPRCSRSSGGISSTRMSSQTPRQSS